MVHTSATFGGSESPVLVVGFVARGLPSRAKILEQGQRLHAGGPPMTLFVLCMAICAFSFIVGGYFTSRR
jgi:hypothetical protein